MKILVPAKRVVDYNVKINVKADGTGVDLANVKMSMNPFDETAIEAAIRLKEAGTASEVVAVSIGPEGSSETLRYALALGADRGLLVKTDATVEPLAVAKLLRALVATESPDLVIMGKQAIDDDSHQTGQMLAALLGWPQAVAVSGLEFAEGSLSAALEVDGGVQTITTGLPAVVTVDLRLNEPRYASLPNIMKAKRKPLEESTPAELGVDIAPRLKVLKTEAPPVRKGGEVVASVAELVARLRDEAGVI